MLDHMDRMIFLLLHLLFLSFIKNEEGAEGEGESSRLLTQHGTWHGSPFQNLEVMTRAEIKSQDD